MLEVCAIGSTFIIQLTHMVRYRGHCLYQNSTRVGCIWIMMGVYTYRSILVIDEVYTCERGKGEVDGVNG